MRISKTRSIKLLLGIVSCAALASASPIFTFAGFQDRSGATVFGFIDYTASPTNSNGSFNRNLATNPCGAGNDCHVFTTISSVTTASVNGDTQPTSATPGAVGVYFNYQGLTGLPGELQGNLSAHMNASIVTSEPAFTDGAIVFTTYQPFNVGGTITFTLDTPLHLAGCPPAGCSNLLTVTVGDLNLGLSGPRGGNTASLIGDVGSRGDNFTFSSDFLSFPGQDNNQLQIGLTSGTPCYTRNQVNNAGSGDVCTTGSLTPTQLGDFVRTFTGNGTGNFAASPAPLVSAVPEPSAMLLAGVGLIALGGITRRRRG